MGGPSILATAFVGGGLTVQVVGCLKPSFFAWHDHEIIMCIYLDPVHFWRSSLGYHMEADNVLGWANQIGIIPHMFGPHADIRVGLFLSRSNRRSQEVIKQVSLADPLQEKDA